jgi:hypothetical protein
MKAPTERDEEEAGPCGVSNRSSGEDRAATVHRIAHDAGLEREVLEAGQIFDLRRSPALSGDRLRLAPRLGTFGHGFSKARGVDAAIVGRSTA